MNPNLILEVLIGLSQEYPDGERCFCEMAKDNPMVYSHSTSCFKAREALKQARAEVEGTLRK